MPAGILIAAALLLHDAPPPGPFPFTEGFDTTAPPGLPAGWLSSRNRSPGVNDFAVNASTPLSPPHAVLSTNATVAQDLQTPLLDFTSAEPESLLFAVRRSSSHVAPVLVEALGGGLTDPVPLGDTLRGTPSTSYVLHRLVLPSALSGRAGIRIRWRILADVSGPTGTFRLDDVRITARALHDLAAASLALSPSPARAGDSLTAVLAVVNRGRAPGGAFTAGLYRDADGDSLAQETELLARASHPGPLPPGDTIRFTMNAGPHPAGLHLFLGVVAYPPDQSPANDTMRLAHPVGAAERSVVLNEILYAPSGGDPEWTEIHHPGSDTLVLTGWTIRDRSGSRRSIPLVPPGLAPGGYAVLTRDTAHFRTRFPGCPGRLVQVAGFPALNNEGDELVLEDAAQCRVDSVAYLPSWGGGDGRSLERCDPQGVSSDAENWGSCADTAGATPGARNSIAVLDTDLVCRSLRAEQVPPGEALPLHVTILNMGRRPPASCTLVLYRLAEGEGASGSYEMIREAAVTPPPALRESTVVTLLWQDPPEGRQILLALLHAEGDGRARNDTARDTALVAWPPGTLVITEILYEPLAGQPEFLEVQNVSSQAVDVSAWTLADAASAAGATFSRDEPRRVNPGEFLVVAGDSSLFTAFPAVRMLEERLVHVVRGGLGLNNDGDAVVLKDGGGWGVDSVSYDPSWHVPGADDVRGRSLERIHPSLPSNDPRSWSTCARAAGGTPGARNSIFTASPVSGAVLAAAPSPFSPDGDGHEDFTMIRYRLPTDAALVRIRIYDARGRLVRLLAAEALAGPEGEMVWDGLDDERRRVRMGIYLILLEAADARGGTVRQAKAAVVVAGRL